VGIINDDPLLFQNLNSAAIAGNLTSIQFTNSSDVAGDFSGTTIFIPQSLLLGASNDNSGTELDTINLVFTIGHESSHANDADSDAAALQSFDDELNALQPSNGVLNGNTVT
jgi:hypothetical protein